MLTPFARNTLVCTIAFAPGCYLLDRPRRLPTFDGPENVRLLDGVHGTLFVFEQKLRGEYKAYHIDGAAERSATRHELADSDAGWMCGPDEQGRVAYIVQQRGFSPFSGPSYSVRWRTWTTGEERTLAKHDGWPDSTAVAISRRGGRVAYSHAEKSEGGGARRSILVVDLEDGSMAEFPVVGWGLRGFHWLEHDRRVVYSQTLRRQALPAGLRAHGGDPQAAPEDRVSVVCLLDTDTGSHTMLALCDQPYAVCGQNAIAIQQEDGCFFIDATDGHVVRPFRSIPGILEKGTGLFAALDLDRVIYNGRPTTGVEPRYRVGDLLLKEALNPIKLADLRDGSFVTLVQYAWHPRAYLSDCAAHAVQASAFP